MTLGFEAKAKAKHKSGAKAHHSHERLWKARSEWKAKSITRPKHLKNHALRWVEAINVEHCNQWVMDDFTSPNGKRLWFQESSKSSEPDL